ncbi:PD-(D/E)XK nuclease domain-containing protein [Segatella buccae]|uniref:PD-(D/E)XK nuclease domain-containing protein n=1 Tax=Segatella buccae TaxID=28126 RepID=UPI003C6FEA3C
MYILEFELDGTPEDALRQIEENGYTRPFALDSRRLYEIGVNFSLQKCCIDGWKIVSSHLPAGDRTESETN